MFVLENHGTPVLTVQDLAIRTVAGKLSSSDMDNFVYQ